MSTYFLCDFEKNSILYAGELPQSWGNLTSLSEDNDECLKDMGWAGHPNMGFLKKHEVVSRGINPYALEQLEVELRKLEWDKIREERDSRIWQIRWRVERHTDELALGRVPTEDITPVLNYIQTLRDLPQIFNLSNVKWPTPPP